MPRLDDGKREAICGGWACSLSVDSIGILAKSRVTVPEAFYKVVFCPEPLKAIGFIYKNKSGNRPLDAYVNSVDEVERITGIDFFPSLPDSVEEAVEAVYELEEWQMPER